MKNFLLILAIFFATLSSVAKEINADNIRFCGTMMPYPTNIDKALSQYPDSLTPIFLNHLGRHGARYLSSEKKVSSIESILLKAKAEMMISEKGETLLGIISQIREITNNSWGALDSLGIAEQEGIALRLALNYPPLLKGNTCAIATYVPRAAMSMYSFLHKLIQTNTSFESYTGEGKRFNYLLRFFSTDSTYMSFLNSEIVNSKISDFEKENVPILPAKKLFKDSYKLKDCELKKITMEEYSIISSLPAVGLKLCGATFFTPEEIEKCWEVENYEHYLKRATPQAARAAVPLLESMIKDADEALRGEKKLKMSLRFAHAETIIPLLALLKIEDCYTTEYHDASIYKNWKDWYVSPLASNLQIVYFFTPSGKILVRGALNEVPISLTGDGNSEFALWEDVKNRWENIINLEKEKK